MFVNVGRANVVSDEALLKALDNKWISTAILDVFHEEPVPKVCTVKLRDKELFDKEQIGVKEPFPVPNCQFTS